MATRKTDFGQPYAQTSSFRWYVVMVSLALIVLFIGLS
jgi:hypothetical protein